MTTYTEFVADLNALAIAGHTVLDCQPDSLATADLPARWCEYPVGESERITFGEDESEFDHQMQMLVHVALSPIVQDLKSERYKATLAAMDALETALREMVDGVSYSLKWALRAVLLTVAGQDYTGVEATLTLSE